MKFYLTGLGCPRPERLEMVERLRRSAQEGGVSDWIVDRAEDAEAILLLWGTHLESPLRSEDHQLLSQRADDLFALVGMDHPLYFFPGIYANTKKSQHQPKRIRAYCFIDDNHYVEEEFLKKRERLYYYSFTGGNNCRFRRRLFSMAGRRPDCLIRDTSFHKEWDPNVGNWEQSKRDYAKIIARSKYVLCPKGSGVATMRLFETMRSGGVPVLISDNYVMPEGPDWASFLVRVQEKDIEKLDQILSQYDGRWNEMSHEARKQWEAWFSPQVWIPQIALRIEKIRKSRGTFEKASRWRWPLFRGELLLRRWEQQARRLASRWLMGQRG